MSESMTMETVDVDGAIREAAAVAEGGDSRGDFFRKAALSGGALIGGGTLLGALPALAQAAPSKKQDVAILNFALTLEYLESEFYNDAVKKGGIKDDLLSLTKVVQAHENAHVKFLKKALGSAAVKKPKFDFKNTTSEPDVFLKTAITLEDTGVKAYSGQAPRIAQTAILKAATSILTVEARHASAFRELAGPKGNGAPRGFDHAASMGAILKAVAKTGFIKA